MTTPADLPVNIDTTYADTGATDVKAHQQHHDTVHAFVKAEALRATDSQLRDRSTHTGSQAIGTVTGLQAAIDARAPSTAGTTNGQLPVWNTSTGKYEPTTPTTATATDVPFTPTGTIAATNVQAAIAEVAAEYPAGGGGGTLARVEHNPATQQVNTNATTTFTDVDATNLALTFTAPASGQVDFVAETSVSASSSTGIVQWNLRVGTTDVANTLRGVSRTTTYIRVRCTWRITGLTAGTSYTYKWGHAAAGGSITTISGGSWGPAIFEVRAA